MKRIVIALLTCIALAGCGYGHNNGANNAPGNNASQNGGGAGANGTGGESGGESGGGTGGTQNGGTGGTAGGNSMNESGGAGGAATSTASIMIIRPAEGATVSSKVPVSLQFRVRRGAEDGPIRLQVDEDRPDIVRRMSGTVQIQPLDPGHHTITIAEAESDRAAVYRPAVVHIKAE